MRNFPFNLIKKGIVLLLLLIEMLNGLRSMLSFFLAS